MRITTLVCTALTLLVHHASCKAQMKVEKGVLVLGDADFHKAVDHFNLLLVAFYDPDSDWDKVAAKQFEKAAKHLRKNKKKPLMRLAKVNWWDNIQLAERHNDAKTWPAYIFFKEGRSYVYSGAENALGFTSFMENEQYVMTSKMMEMVKEIEDGKAATDSFAMQAKEGDVALLGSFRELNTQHAITFKKLPWRDNMKHILFGITDDPMAAIRLNIGHSVNGNGGMILYRSWAGPVVYREPLDSGDFGPVLKWLRHESRPSIVNNVLTMDDAVKLAKNGRNVHMYVFVRGKADQEENEEQKIRGALSQVYTKSKGRLLQVISDAFAEDNTDIKEELRRNFDPSAQSTGVTGLTGHRVRDTSGAPAGVVDVVLVKWVRVGGVFKPRIYEMPLEQDSPYVRAMTAEVRKAPSGPHEPGEVPLTGLAAGLDLFARDFLGGQNNVRRLVLSEEPFDDSGEWAQVQ
jgi:hypothetical protein